MRKIIIFVVIMVTAFVPLTSALGEDESNGAKLNLDILKELPGYNYDVFDKAWSYSTAYAEIGEHFKIEIWFVATGKDASATSPYISVRLLNESGNVSGVASSIQFLTDDHVYNFMKLRNEDNQHAYSYIGSVGKEFLTNLQNSESVSFKVVLTNSTEVTCNVNWLSSLKSKVDTWYKNLDNAGIWAQDNQEIMLEYDKMFTASIK